MWSRVPPFLFVLGALFLSGCGFHPVHMPIGEGCTPNYPIKIATIADRYGQFLRNRLVDLLTPEGVPCKPLYLLEITLKDTVIDTGVQKDETINRKQVTLEADFVLRDRKNKVVYKHSIATTNSFAILRQNYYADSVAESYSKKQSLLLLAEKIKILISLFLENHDKN